MRLLPELRKKLVEAVKKGNNKNLVAKVFDVSTVTVWHWCKRAYHRGKEFFKDKPRKPKESKITLEVELYVLAVRNTFSWGTERIRRALANSLPPFMEDKLRELHVIKPDALNLSRAAINNVLKKHGINGYEKKYKSWKFFRAEKPDELWQLDIKGPFTVQGKKYYFVICIDDFSRYMILAEQLDHAPACEEIAAMLQPFVDKHHPKSILTDNNPFKEEWNKWCENNQIESLKAHPYYPQDKGKVERAIRNVNEEFIYLLKDFPEWLHGKLKEYQKWYNDTRFNLGINTVPSALYY